MFGLITVIIIFNFIAFKTSKRLTFNQILHIWTFTVALQVLFDVYINAKYQGYWYFTKEIDWSSLPVYTVLIPPVNIMFLNWYPSTGPLWRKVLYFIPWLIFMLIYELIANRPEPWGYFHYGWWNLWHSAIIDPILLLILLGYYKVICKAEEKLKLD